MQKFTYSIDIPTQDEMHDWPGLYQDLAEKFFSPLNNLLRLHHVGYLNHHGPSDDGTVKFSADFHAIGDPKHYRAWATDVHLVNIKESGICGVGDVLSLADFLQHLARYFKGPLDQKAEQYADVVPLCCFLGKAQEELALINATKE